MPASSFSTHALAPFAPDWDAAAADVVALLRVAASRDPLDKQFSDLVGEL